MAKLPKYRRYETLGSYASLDHKLEGAEMLAIASGGHRLRTGVVLVVGCLLMIGGRCADDVARGGGGTGDDAVREAMESIFKSSKNADDFIDDAGRFTKETDDLAIILERNGTVLPDTTVSLGVVSDDLSREYQATRDRAQDAVRNAACELAFDYAEDGDFDTTWQDVAQGMASALLVPPTAVSQLTGWAEKVYEVMNTYASQGSSYGFRMIILKYRYCEG